MVAYRALAPQYRKQKSPRRAARDRVRADLLTRPTPVVNALPHVPTKLQQLEALVRAGRIEDPFMDGVVSSDTDLTSRVRELYENSVVPVREIARLAGVSERTLYKYAARYGWVKRHRSLLKGAGGRFVSQEEAQRPQSHGLKALDPVAATQASADAEKAQELSDAAAAVALAQAAREEQSERRFRAAKDLLETVMHCKAILRTQKSR